MNSRSIIVFCGLVLLCPWQQQAQCLFDINLPATLEGHPDWQALSEQKRDLTERFRTLLEKQGPGELSANTLFYLDLAFRELSDYGADAFQERLQSLFRRRPLYTEWEEDLGVFLDTLAPIDQELTRLKRVYRYAERHMQGYIVDTVDHIIRKELDFYALRSGERVAEVGAGDERFAAAVGITADGIDYYLNEIDYDLLEGIAFHLQYNPVFNSGRNTFELVLGSSTSTGLESLRLDKVIIRNAFHHFDRPQEMLRSVKEALAPMGRLFIKEMPLERCRGQCCELLLSGTRLLQELQEAGFVIVRQQLVTEYDGEWSLLMLQVDPNH